jgi:hypothetical protein
MNKIQFDLDFLERNEDMHIERNSRKENSSKPIQPKPKSGVSGWVYVILIYACIKWIVPLIDQETQKNVYKTREKNYTVNSSHFQQSEKLTVTKTNAALESLLNTINALEKEEADKKLTLIEKKLPQNGIIKKYTNRELLAPFKISSEKSSIDSEDSPHFYIKLIDVSTNKTILTLFLRQNSSLEINVPLGKYKLRYASGNTWYGETDLFGPSTLYGKSDEVLSFEKQGMYLSGHQLKLRKIVNGNFSTQKIRPEEF